MTESLQPMDSLTLKNLQLGSPQVLGGIRIVPVLRNEIPGDLRLASRKYQDDITSVVLDDRTMYHAYVPHALVARWTSDGKPATPYGTQIFKHKKPKTRDGACFNDGFTQARVMPRMRIKEGPNQLRFLPLHLAMEGFLAYQFGGPKILWEEYAKSVVKDGLSPRTERVIHGRQIIGLEDALRLFEIHERQVGSILFVADALASAFIVSHPDDYARMHSTLISDFYGELIYHFGFFAAAQDLSPTIDADKVSSLECLRLELGRVRDEWATMHHWMSNGLFTQPIESESVFKMGEFSLRRFRTNLNPKQENHIGEMILRSDGTLEYLKTYRLSAAQCRRAYLLKQLAECQWDLEACSELNRCTKNQLVYRLEKAGFGYLLHQHILDAAKAEARRHRTRK